MLSFFLSFSPVCDFSLFNSVLESSFCFYTKIYRSLYRFYHLRMTTQMWHDKSVAYQNQGSFSMKFYGKESRNLACNFVLEVNSLHLQTNNNIQLAHAHKHGKKHVEKGEWKFAKLYDLFLFCLRKMISRSLALLFCFSVYFIFISCVNIDCK